MQHDLLSLLLRSHPDVQLFLHQIVEQHLHLINELIDAFDHNESLQKQLEDIYVEQPNPYQRITLSYGFLLMSLKEVYHRTLLLRLDLLLVFLQLFLHEYGLHLTFSSIYK